MSQSRKRRNSPEPSTSFPIQTSAPHAHQVSVLFGTEGRPPYTLQNRIGSSLLQLSKPHNTELLALDVTSTSSLAGDRNRSLLAMGGMDKFISIWDCFGSQSEGTDDSMGDEDLTVEKEGSKAPKVHASDTRTCYILRGHKNAVTSVRFVNRDAPQNLLESQFGATNALISSSADNTCIVWDLNLMKMRRRYREHDAVVNEVALVQLAGTEGSTQWASASDDFTVKLWDERDRAAVQTLRFDAPQLTVHASRASDPRNTSGNNATLIACAGVDNVIRVYDSRRLDDVYLQLEEHTDSITSIKFSPDQCSIASFSMDQSIVVHDVKSFSSLPNRVQKKIYGPTHGADNNLIRLAWANYDTYTLACGSSDGLVYLLDTLTGKMKSKLRGHSGTVNDVAFHPDDPILCSCSSDHSTIIGDITV